MRNLDVLPASFAHAEVDGRKVLGRERAESHLPQHSSVIVDALWERVWVDGQPTAWTTRLLEELLFTAGTLNLVVIAHGDGAHLEFSDLVVCEAWGGPERSLPSGEPVPGGCDGSGFCKRNSGGRNRLASEVRAKNVILMSCKTGVLLDPFFPVTSNISVALLRGHARNVVTPLGNSVLCPALGLGGESFLREPVETLLDVLDDLATDGTTRFCFYGESLAAFGPTDTQAGGLASLQPAEEALRRVLPATDLTPGRHYVIGRTHAIMPTSPLPRAIASSLDCGRSTGCGSCGNSRSMRFRRT